MKNNINNINFFNYTMLFMITFYLCSCTDINHHRDAMVSKNINKIAPVYDNTVLREALKDGYNHAELLENASYCGPDKQGCFSWIYEFEF